MIPPIPYRGEKPYIFISYAHKDSAQVWPIIKQMQQDGYRVWYDEGIDPGTEWDENIASHVSGCDYFIAFVSEQYLKSDNCKDELNFARDLEKNQVLVYLEDVKLPPGMALRFGRLQQLQADKYGFFAKLYETEGIEAFHDGTVSGAKKKKNWGPVICGVLVLAAALLLLGVLRKIPQSDQEGQESVQTVADDPATLKKTTFLSSETGVRMTAQNLFFDEEGNLVLEVEMENDTDRMVSLRFGCSYLNGIRCEQEVFLAVPADTTDTAQLRWRKESLKNSGLGDIQKVTDITVIEGRYQAEIEDDYSHQERFLYYPYGESNAKLFTYTADSDDIILVDREDYQLIFTDHYLNEQGEWVGEFVSTNLTDRHLSATVALRSTNGYVYGTHMVEYIRAGQSVRSRILLNKWQMTQQDAIYQIEGTAALQDTDAGDWIVRDLPITIYPEGEENYEFPLRSLEQDDKILLENDYVKVAIIKEYQEHGYQKWSVYCLNLSEKTVDIRMVAESGKDWYEWYIGTLGPGEQCFDTISYCPKEDNTNVFTADLVVMEDESNGELSRDSICLEFTYGE